MFFFPIRSDRRLQSIPWVNYGVIGVNVLVYALLSRVLSEEALRPYLLDPALPRLHQFVTYQFLHAGFMHLLGNMVFLYVFGNHVEDRVGHVGYLCFYLAGGVLAGVGHATLEPSPVLGASGAVCAVTGAYLALFPLTHIRILYWIFVAIGEFEVSGLILILFQIAQDAVMFFTNIGSVAYLAHLSGYVFGFAVGMLLLRSRLLPREPYDMLAMIEHRRRKAQFRSMTRSGYQPWDHAGYKAEVRTVDRPTNEQQQRVMELRARIIQRVNAHNLPQAATLYRDLLGLDARQVLSQDHQLDVANQLMSDGEYTTAARAYELFLSTFPGYAQREQVQLILGLIYARYLDRKQRARELLGEAVRRLSDPQQVELAKRMLNDIPPADAP